MAGADPGSPYEGAPTLQEEAPTYDFCLIFQKTHEIENILGRRGRSLPGVPPLDPPLDGNLAVFNAHSLRTTPLCFSTSECTTYLKGEGGKTELHFRVKYNSAPSPPDREN